MEERYFAASNSKNGFLSYFGEVFSPEKLEKLYIIKGGPGTGKNMFMRSVAELAEKKGMRVTKYYCSSDQNSLDGIMIDGRIGFVDGTAPHSFECIYPGAVDNIIDLGAFWDSEGLSRKREKIEKLNSEKNSCYRRAYRYLASYHQLSEALSELTEPLLDLDGLNASVEKLLDSIPSGENYGTDIVICDSVGMEGRVYFDTLINKAEKVIYIKDRFESGHIYLAAAEAVAARKGLGVTLSYDPVESDRLDALLLRDSGFLLTSKCPNEKDANKTVEMDLFFDKEKLNSVIGRIESTLELREIMMEEALLAMKDIKNAHFDLEGIYKDKMDFEAKEKYTEQFLKKLFSGLEE